MQAYFFGDGGRRLLACFHPAAPCTSVQARPAVLICGPYGQEAVRSHRLLRVLADRLSRAGHAVLRFDPYGSGDSGGDDEDVELAGWQCDVLQASGELHRRSPGRPQVWLGFRLGATVACWAANRAVSTKPIVLALVEPLADGPAYLDELALSTVQSLEASMSIKNPAWRRSLQQEPQRWQREAVGLAMGAAMYAQLSALKAQDVALAQDITVNVVVPTDAAREQVLSWPWVRRRAGLSVFAVPYQFDWTAEEALNCALVPHNLVAQLLGCCEAPGAPRR